MKIAINKCYGGFSISHEAALKLREKGVKVTLEGEKFPDGSGPLKYGKEDGYHLSNDDFDIKDDNYNLWRCDKRLIEVIEELGEKESSGRRSNIVIVDIPDDVEWEIDEYDGKKDED